MTQRFYNQPDYRLLTRRGREGLHVVGRQHLPNLGRRLSLCYHYRDLNLEFNVSRQSVRLCWSLLTGVPCWNPCIHCTWHDLKSMIIRLHHHTNDTNSRYFPRLTYFFPYETYIGEMSFFYGTTCQQVTTRSFFPKIVY